MRVGVALVGTGKIGRVHAAQYVRARPLLAAGGIELDVPVVVDLDVAAASEVARDVGAAPSDRWDDAVARADVDLVDVCLPDALHAEVAIAAAELGKHVLCQKPLASTLEESVRMVAAVRRARVVGAVDFAFRRLPAVALARELIEQGALGDIHTFRALFARDVALLPAARGMWRLSAGGSSLHAMGSHALDLARWLVGDIARVTASTCHADPGDGRNTEDVANVLLGFGSGAQGVLQTTWSAAGHQHHTGIELHGTGGSLALNGERPNELHVAYAGEPAGRDGFTLVRAARTRPHAAALGLDSGVASGFHDATLILLCDAVRAVALDDDAGLPTFEDGRAVDRLIEAATCAARGRRWIELEPDGKDLAA